MIKPGRTEYIEINIKQKIPFIDSYKIEEWKCLVKNKEQLKDALGDIMKISTNYIWFLEDLRSVVMGTKHRSSLETYTNKQLLEEIRERGLM